jgi:hypothetical protein
MIKTEKLTKLFATEEVQTKAIPPITYRCLRVMPDLRSIGVSIRNQSKIGLL